MNIKLKKSTLNGEIKAPSSKSMTHRALIASSIAKGNSRIRYPLISEDTNSTLNALSMLGAQIKEEEHLWEIKGGNLHASNKPLKCKESGTTLRLFTGLCSIRAWRASTGRWGCRRRASPRSCGRSTAQRSQCWGPMACARFSRRTSSIRGE